MKWLICAILSLMILVPVVWIARAIDEAPSVSGGEPINVEDVERVKSLFKRNDPRKFREGESREITMTERDINLGIEYALSKLPVPGDAHARTVLGWGHCDIEASVPIDRGPLSGYLNIAARFVPAARGMAMASLRVGKVTVPEWLQRRLFDRVEPRMGGMDGYRELKDVFNSMSNIQFEEDRLALTLTWQGDLADRIEQKGRELVLPAAEQELVVAHFQKLGAILGGLSGRELSLTRVLRPMMEHVSENIAMETDARAAVRTALLTLALYVAADAGDIRRLLGNDAAARLPRLPRIRLQLQERTDLAQHFLVSTALSGTAGSAIADVIGVFKEVQDSRGGSGFSFEDLAADRAGVRFAELAALDPKRLLAKARTIAHEDDYMPSVHALPEAMQEPAFIQRFQNRDSEAYAIVTAEFDRRIDACRLFQ